MVPQRADPPIPEATIHALQLSAFAIRENEPCTDRYLPLEPVIRTPGEPIQRENARLQRTIEECDSVAPETAATVLSVQEPTHDELDHYGQTAGLRLDVIAACCGEEGKQAQEFLFSSIEEEIVCAEGAPPGDQ